MNKGPQTLVMLSPVFSEDEQGDWLPWQAVLVRTLNELYPSLKIVILAFHFPVVAGKKYTWHGNEVIAFGGGMKGKLHTVSLWLRAWQQLKQLNKEQNIVGIFSFFCSECAFIGHHFARRNGLTHKIWVLGQDAGKNNHQVRRIRPSADELICISDFLQREFYKNHGVRPEHIIPIGIDPRSLPGAGLPRKTDLLGAGSLIPLKQYDVFVDVVKMVSEKLPSVNAVICGDGAEHKRLTDKIASLNLSGNITLAGHKMHTDVLQLMHESKIFLHTSSYEGLGVVNLEALYAGAHVISFCKPLDAAITHWHIVETKEEMARKALELLTGTETKYEPVLVYAIYESARQIMRLFGLEQETV